MSGIVVGALPIINGIVFSDLGQASNFMALDWVQKTLSECLGFAPFPATLNVRPADRDDAATWESVQNDASRYFLMPSHGGSCNARIFRIEIYASARKSERKTAGAILLPEVEKYPKNKIEIVAPTRLKETFGVSDGDQITLEFIN
ncbi:MAG: CTP-dependent riboflavin kinase [Deltaproteobacteria bacterium]|nr:CTP-dependent riboflavin kinase [Deltaproteobacteria bacterium]